MDLQGFADLWEHVRLLSDTPRNEALLGMLERRAPGARVLEIGCGSGLLSCIAARLGAKKVYAVEPTAQAEAAAAMVQANGLSDVVEVLVGRVQDLEPRPVDLAFSELLNADPFAEEILEAMEGAAPWVAPGGRLAPSRLRVWVALVRENSSAVEVRNVRRTLMRLAERHELDLSALITAMDELHPYAYVSPKIAAVTAPVCIADLRLGTAERPTAQQRVEIPIEEPGPIGGAVIWFEAELDDGIVMHNAPGSPGHWGHMVCGWPEEVGGRLGGSIALDVQIDDDSGITVTPAP